MSDYTTPYAALDWAETYFAERSGSDNWSDANDENKLAALKTATRDIFKYAIFVEVVTETINEFPEEIEQEFRYLYDGTETRTIPNALKEACCEQAIYKLTVNRLNAVDATRSGLASAKGASFDRNAIPAQLCDECIDILEDMGATVKAAAGSNTMTVTRFERIQA